MYKKFVKFLLHNISRTRQFYHSKLETLSLQSEDKIILEIGSGRKINGKEAYSAKHIFPNAKEFHQTDINPEHGHDILDITKMEIVEQYDIILCLNVLEHVYEAQKAINNLRNALRSGGTLIVAVPFAFPLHDEPHDYWRFTSFSLEKLLTDFNTVNISSNGSSKCPFGYFVEAIK